MREPESVTIVFGDLFDGLGTPGLSYRAAAAALDGRRVAITGYVVPVHGRSDRFLLVDAPGACPDCSPVPIPALALGELSRPPTTIGRDATAVRIEGRLRVGYEVDDDGEATFLRLHECTLFSASGEL